MSACVICRHSDNPVADRFGHISVLHCTDCGVEYADPLIYDRASYEVAYADHLSGEVQKSVAVPSTRWLKEASSDLRECVWMLSSAQVKAIEWLRSNADPSSAVVDIGCGSGWFLGALRAIGFQSCGVEVASDPVRLLQERGFKVVHGSLEAVPRNWNPQFATLFEVLEHLPNPIEFLALIRQRFPKTTLLLSVPSPRRWTKPMGRRDIADYPPNHLTRWNEVSLKRALRMAGYSGVNVTFPPVTALEIASAAFRPLLRCWIQKIDTLETAVAGCEPTRSLTQEVVVRRFKVLAFIPLEFALNLLGYSSISMLAIAR